MSAITQHKTRLRQQLRQQRQTLSTTERNAAADMIARHTLALPHWAQLSNVAIYLATDCEADPQPLARRALEQGKHLFLPVIQAKRTLQFARWEPGDSLIKNTFGIGEPAAHIQRVTAATMDLICLPLVGWSSAGTRLGMGGGFYDRTLTSASDTIRLGLGYNCQHSADIPREHWDVGLHWVATESGLHQCSSTDAAT